MSEDLWGEISLDEREENRSIDILRTQATLIGEKTDNYVKGTFYKTRKYSNGAVAGLKKLNEFMKSTKGANGAYEREVDLDSKEDYNINFRRELYNFEIYNEEYRFRIFTLNYSIEYPVEIIPDEGICKDMNSSECISVNDNDALEEIVRNIFSTKKVKLIINRMTNQTQGKIEQKIIEYASVHSSFTTKELAEAEGWSINNTVKRLKTLDDKEIIEVEQSRPEKKWKLRQTSTINK